MPSFRLIPRDERFFDLFVEDAANVLDGARQLEVQSGTQPGARLRLQGLGVPSLRNGRRGDLVVEVDVQVPTNLTPEQAELLVQLAQLRGEEVTAPHEGLFSRIRSAFRS